jgi:hypothetical protein
LKASLEHGIADFDPSYTRMILFMYLVCHIALQRLEIEIEFDIVQVERMLEEKFGPILFPDVGKDSRICPR